MMELRAKTLFNQRVTASDFVLGLQAPEIVRQAEPGQFVMLKVRTGTSPLLRRPFSICALQDDLLLILYRVVGEGTRLMTKISPGEEIPLLGPLGKGFIRPAAGQFPILVAGGIGIAPLIFLASQWNLESFHFLAGFKTAAEITLLGKNHLPCLAFSPATDDGSAGFSGFVTGLLEKTLDQETAKKKVIIYACGPNAMLKKVVSLANDSNLACQVSLESSMACGLGACQGCAVHSAPGQKQPFYHVCKDGPVFSARCIDWTTL